MLNELSVKWVAHIGHIVIWLLLSSNTQAENNKKWTDLNIGGNSDAHKTLPFFPHRANTSTNQALDKGQFNSAQTCGGCHTTIYDQWKSSMMGFSWDDPIYRALLKRASEATQGAVDNFCTGCHSPIGLTTGQITSEINRQGPQAASKDGLPGIDCEGCHNISGRSGIDNGAYHMSQAPANAQIKYGSRADASSPFHKTQYSELHTRSDFCGVCHNVTHPFNNVPIERTYDEWLESTYSREGRECQSCHMPRFAGKAAVNGPDRPDVASHSFPGGNSTVLLHFGEEKAAGAARAMLKTAAELSFESLPERVKPGSMQRVSVRVANTGAGHKLPTGFPEGREIWLDFTVTDGRGKTIFRLGKIENGKTEKNTKNFKVHLGDENGKEVDIEVWNVTHIISDNRILPKGYSVADFDFFIPEDSVGPYTLHADLNYWPFPQALVDELLGKGVLKVDVVRMDEVTATLTSNEIADIRSVDFAE